MAFRESSEKIRWIKKGDQASIPDSFIHLNIHPAKSLSRGSGGKVFLGYEIRKKGKFYPALQNLGHEIKSRG